MSQSADIPFGPLAPQRHRADAPPGSLQACVNLAWTGGAEQPQLTPAEAPTNLFGWTTLTRPILSFGRQATVEGERMVGLQAGRLVSIDPDAPGLTIPQTLHAFEQEDESRRATFAMNGRSLVAAVTCERGGVRRPELMLELIGDDVYELEPPPLPEITVDTSTTGELRHGRYVAQAAWVMEGGLVGPLGVPRRIELEEGEGDEPLTYGLSFRAGIFDPPGGRKAFFEKWGSRLRSLRVFLRPSLLENPDEGEDALGETDPMAAPAYEVANIPAEHLYSTQTWERTQEQVWAAPRHPNAGNLITRRPKAGAVGSYNRRLMLGDVAYEYPRPDLESLIRGPGPIDYPFGPADMWLMLEVFVQTGTTGEVRRYSDPVHIVYDFFRYIYLTEGMIWYPDQAATKWRLLVSEDYGDAGSIEAATWKKVGIPNVSPVGEPAGFTSGDGNFAYSADPWEGPLDPYGIGDEVDVAGGLQGDTVAEARGIEPQGEEVFSSYDLSPFGSSLTIRPTWIATRWFDEDNSNAAPNWEDTVLEVEVTFFDDAGRELTSHSYAEDHSDLVGYIYKEERTWLSPIDVPRRADSLQIRLRAEIMEEEETGDGFWLRLEVGELLLEGIGRQEPVEISRENELDHDPTRVLVSDVDEPRGLQARRAAYVGDSPADRVQGFAAATLPISQGQFGSYPLYVLGRESVHVGEVGGGDTAFAAWRKVSPKGCVGRGAFCNVESAVAFASDDGVWLLDPQLGSRPTSAPLHRPDGAFLQALSQGAALGYYNDSTRGRRELWVGAGDLTFSFSLETGRWSILDRRRATFCRAGGRLWGTPEHGYGMGLYDEGGGGAGRSVRYLIETGLLHMGAPGLWKRFKRLSMRQMRTRPAGPEWTTQWALHDEDPTGRVEVAGGTAPASTDTVRLPRGMARLPSIQIFGEDRPGTLLGGLSLEYDVRNADRAPELPHLQERLPWSPLGGIEWPETGETPGT